MRKFLSHFRELQPSPQDALPESTVRVGSVDSLRAWSKGWTNWTSSALGYRDENGAITIEHGGRGVDLLAHVLPHADRAVLRTYLDRARGDEFSAFRAYLEDEGMATLPSGTPEHMFDASRNSKSYEGNGSDESGALIFGSGIGSVLPTRSEWQQSSPTRHTPQTASVTGIASSKRNADFHQRFPHIPKDDYLVEDYACALVKKEALVQGRIYLSKSHMCFAANGQSGQSIDPVIPFYEVTSLEKRTTVHVIPNALQIYTRIANYTFACFLSRDRAYDVIHTLWRLSRPELGSLHKPTQCVCEKEGDHFRTLVMDIVVPGTPETIYNLMFTSGFLKEFMAEKQKFSACSLQLARNMSYIKPLDGSIGPKQTGCELKNETVHIDFDDYVSILTTTHTPDVSGGKMFMVKTSTCIMWASAAASRLVVTTAVEWTGRSFIKSLVNKSTISSQIQYYASLENAMRSYIFAHRPEFIPRNGVEDPEALSWLESARKVGGGPPHGSDADPEHTIPLVPPPKAASLGHLHSPTLLTTRDREILVSQVLAEKMVAQPLDGTQITHVVRYPSVSTKSSASSEGSSTNEGASSPITPGFSSHAFDTGQYPNGLVDVLQSHSPKRVASITYECLVEHSCPDLMSLINPLGLSSSAVAEGRFGDIWVGRFHNTKTKLAVKVLRFASLTNDTTKKELKRITREIYHWSKLDNENVNKLLGVVMFRERLGMVSEWMEHGNLRQYINRNDNIDRPGLCVQIARGVAYLHGVNMVHGDLKACNILVSSAGILKITDFGYSIFPECSLAFSATTRMGGGTLRWMAPELLLDETPLQRDMKTDIYALGVTLLETITNGEPYLECERDVQIYHRLARKEHPIRTEEYFPDTEWGNKMWKILLQCWDFIPISRPTASDVLASLLTLEKETRDAP
ncbi:tyrosine kinase family catalytic domain protein [Rhizoctonia solani 123E]|uniref:Tyrosine kinase family catalytic domain protein n=1 Tax=Rhizoctonia solani 123E TaxID=1423351 RepID=A0A074SBI5_9AGAM|nr:tyrosine kinase family catalytic domain protein [Rhizoctonia solani 123E]